MPLRSHRAARSDEGWRNYYSARVEDRLVAELLGFCKGIIADGVVTEEEAIALGVWVRSHPDVAVGFPGRELAERISAIFRDGVADEQERSDLGAMLADLVGERGDRSGTMNNSTALPIDHPEPTIFFEGKEYVFTGHFCMPRRLCEAKVVERAGRVWGDVRRATDYVVVGAVATKAWVQAAWGTKILAAMDLKASGHPIAIIGETHWLMAIERGG